MEENSELPNLNEADKAQDSPESIAADESEITARNWWSILQLLGAYLVGAWTILQFLDWIFTRNQISPYWVDLFMWIFIGLLPAILFYLFYKERIDRFGSNRRDKFVFSSNLVILILVLFFSFRNTDLGATTKEITFVDASGAAQHKTILKQEFRKKIMIVNFEPQDVDSSFLWLNGGIRTLLALDAQQDKAFLIGNQTGKTAGEIQKHLASTVGLYGDRRFWLEEGRLFYKRTALDQTYFPQMELLPISEDRYINLSRQYIRYGFDYENDQAIASYSYIFNRDSSTWSRNSLEDDYILRLKN